MAFFSVQYCNSLESLEWQLWRVGNDKQGEHALQKNNASGQQGGVPPPRMIYHYRKHWQSTTGVGKKGMICLMRSMALAAAGAASSSAGFIQLSTLAFGPGMAITTKPISIARAQEIECETRGQRVNPLWYKYHTFTITAFSFKKVCRRKTYNQAFFTDLFSAKNLDYVPTTNHEIEHEEEVVKDYFDHSLQTDKTLTFGECGLCLHPHFSFLGASPDSVVFDETSSPPIGLVEVECPYTTYTKEQTVIEVAMDRHQDDFCCELVQGSPSQKINHPYFYYTYFLITGLKWCDFVVRLGKDKLFVQRIQS